VQTFRHDTLNEIEDVSEYLVELEDEEPTDLLPAVPDTADDFQDVILEETNADEDIEKDSTLV